jgi:hypothetical protein
MRYLLVLVVAAGCWGQDALSVSESGWMKVPIKYSAVFLLAAQSADTATTVRGQGRELNPLPRPTAVAWASTGALLAAEYLLRHHPHISRALSVLNLGLAGEHGYAAIHNGLQ